MKNTGETIVIKGIKLKNAKMLIILTIIIVAYSIIGTLISFMQHSKETATMFTVSGAGIFILVFLFFRFFKQTVLKLEDGNFTLNNQDVKIKEYKIYNFWELKNSISLSIDNEKFLLFALTNKYNRRKISAKLHMLEKEFKERNIPKGEYDLNFWKAMILFIVSFLSLFLPTMFVN